MQSYYNPRESVRGTATSMMSLDRLELPTLRGALAAVVLCVLIISRGVFKLRGAFYVVINLKPHPESKMRWEVYHGNKPREACSE